MDIINLGATDGLPPVKWATVVEKLDAGSPPAPDAHNARTTWLSTVNKDGSPHVTAVGAARETDSATLTRIAKAWADQGWRAELDETGSGITAPFNAPSQGPPPWNVYRIKPHSVTVALGTESGGLTRFKF
jgi:hypothetical protein